MDKNLLNLFHDSFNHFLESNLDNILNGVAERNLCARLGLNFEFNFQKYGLEGYYADAEYNRKQGGEVKTILDNETEIIPIQCDLIIHSRGGIISNDNLIAIEMKKSGRPEEEKIKDRKRLRALTKESYDDIWSNDGITLPEQVCGYDIGIYLILNITKRYFDIEYYFKGKYITKTQKNF
ncbi:hypothetical protein OF897_16045 [Chryseobacterium formosus]|uniref:PD-(D/E)XK nuclease superfamily protein n=1 Tax=Chryseobacterium formosus TaxID=1537363 RepID=A0ABT3XUV5_9FLAO|nr:hypothetical protein [Chryseobacterium formosus]MCX8525427.1 hypothetical protein [Chryseobacterium formosus]